MHNAIGHRPPLYSVSWSLFQFFLMKLIKKGFDHETVKIWFINRRINNLQTRKKTDHDKSSYLVGAYDCYSIITY